MIIKWDKFLPWIFGASIFIAVVSLIKIDRSPTMVSAFNPLDPDIEYGPDRIADAGIYLTPFPGCDVELIIVPEYGCRDVDINKMYDVISKTIYQ